MSATARKTPNRKTPRRDPPSRRRRVIFWSVIAVVGIVVVTGVSLLVCNLVITTSADNYIVSSPLDAPHSQCAIVLGARVFEGGAPAPILVDRLQVGVELYRLGKVDKLLLSGDHGQTTYDEVNSMLAYVLEQGVPEEDVFTDHAGFDTYDTMYRARDVFQVKSAIVVTQDFHLSRAIYTARRLGIDAFGVSADLRTYSHPVRNELRESLARVNAILQLHLTHPEPKYLGPEIPITGDGRATRG